MKILNLAITLVLCTMFTAQCTSGNDQSEDTAVVIEDVGVEKFNELIEEGKGVLLDVRTQQEYDESHLGSCILYDFYKDGFNEKLEGMDKEKPVYVYCRSGGRSMEAAIMMEEMGFKKVYNLKGGIIAWNAKDMPVEQ